MNDLAITITLTELGTRRSLAAQRFHDFDQAHAFLLANLPQFDPVDLDVFGTVNGSFSFHNGFGGASPSYVRTVFPNPSALRSWCESQSDVLSLMSVFASGPTPRGTPPRRRKKNRRNR